MIFNALAVSGSINVTAGTITLSSDANNYVLTHGLGEVPKFFAIGMADKFSTLAGKTYLFIGGWGFSDIPIQYRTSANSTSYSPSSVLREYSITANGSRTSFDSANEQTITLASSGGTVKLIGGATYYWVTIGSGVF